MKRLRLQSDADLWIQKKSSRVTNKLSPLISSARKFLSRNLSRLKNPNSLPSTWPTAKRHSNQRSIRKLRLPSSTTSSKATMEPSLPTDRPVQEKLTRWQALSMMRKNAVLCHVPSTEFSKASKETQTRLNFWWELPIWKSTTNQSVICFLKTLKTSLNFTRKSTLASTWKIWAILRQNLLKKFARLCLLVQKIDLSVKLWWTRILQGLTRCSRSLLSGLKSELMASSTFVWENSTWSILPVRNDWEKLAPPVTV